MPSSLSEAGSYTVSYSDTDQNGHMNNTRYPDMYANFLPLRNKRIKTVSIQYVSEAPIGETLAVYSCFEDGVYYFKTVRADGKINSLASVELADLD